MNHQDLLKHLEREGERHHGAAARALDALIADACRARSNLSQRGYDQPSTIAGSHLNRQLFEDAERALVLGYEMVHLHALINRSED
jgi:hypothetical protein